MAYQKLERIPHDILAFQFACSLETFDLESESVKQEFEEVQSAHLDLYNKSFKFLVKQTLIPSGLVEALDNAYHVTAMGRVWAQVFEIRSDGTFVVFGSPIDKDAWTAFRHALYSFIEMIYQQELRPLLHRPARFGGRPKSGDS
jgi:hypothetical protein